MLRKVVLHERFMYATRTPASSVGGFCLLKNEARSSVGIAAPLSITIANVQSMFAASAGFLCRTVGVIVTLVGTLFEGLPGNQL